MKNLFEPFLIVAVAGCLASQAGAAQLSCSEMEDFLLHAHAGAPHALSVGVTNTNRVTMQDERIRHDAHIQTVDESKTRFEGSNGGIELNFRDSYKYNIAAYELAKMLGLNMVPPYVERKVTMNRGSVSWWVNDSMMEAERHKKNLTIPEQENWNKQMYAVRVFHELVYDTDPNLTNLLISKDWRLWIIDLTRAFRTDQHVREPKNLVKCDRRLLERMRAIDEDRLKEKLSRWLTKTEIHALNSRRAWIVKYFDAQAAGKGETEVMYDFAATAEACGTGL